MENWKLDKMFMLASQFSCSKDTVQRASLDWLPRTSSMLSLGYYMFWSKKLTGYEDLPSKIRERPQVKLVLFEDFRPVSMNLIDGELSLQ